MASERKSALSRIVWILLAAGVVVYAMAWTFRAYRLFGDQLSALCGITLGDTRGEIRYKRGEPPIVYGDLQPGDSIAHPYYTDREKDPDNALPEGADITTYHTWTYYNGSSPNPQLDITFDPALGRVSKIDCIDQSDPPTNYCTRLAGLGIGDQESRIVSFLGTPTRQPIDEKSGVKTMEYSDLGLVFLLARQRVYGISVRGTDAHKRVSISRFLIWTIGTLAQ